MSELEQLQTAIEEIIERRTDGGEDYVLAATEIIDLLKVRTVPVTQESLDEIAKAKRDLQAAVRGDDHWGFHTNTYPVTGDDEESFTQMYRENMAAPAPEIYEHAHAFMATVFGEDAYTPDSIGQLVEVFVPCLRIMVERPYEPEGKLWRKAGLFNVMGDVKKKYERYWYRTWTEGKRHDDSGVDLINFVAFTLRIDPDSRFGDAGEPAPPAREYDDA